MAIDANQGRLEVTTAAAFQMKAEEKSCSRLILPTDDQSLEVEEKTKEQQIIRRAKVGLLCYRSSVFDAKCKQNARQTMKQTKIRRGL